MKTRTDVIIDVRAPVEYARGRMPGAVNVPLLDDAERHLLGLCYKNEGARAAAELGVELFAAKADRYADALLAAAKLGTHDCPEFRENGDSRVSLISVYCWRGGMRSGFVSRFMRAMGLRPNVVKGGYKAYRNQVLALLDELATKELVVLDGRTGSGKTDLLRSLPADVPKIDLEGLAKHRGSAFGDFAIDEPSPTQQDFENQLAAAYEPWRAAKRLVVEIETLIGPVHVPPKLRERVVSSPTVLVSRDFDDRVERLAAEYARGWGAREDALFEERLKLLSQHMTVAERLEAIAGVKARDFKAVTALLLRARYDKIYDKGLARRAAQVEKAFNLTHEEEAARHYLVERCR